MCLATPVKLVKISEGMGTVQHGKEEHSVKLDLIESPKVGDWLLCHADLAINKISPKEASKILGLVAECSHRNLAEN